ncbi:uncharacterized protein LOC126903098 isoform X2 [Daktulosphaira vitifoliae]|uniref:uncharacterized protein LOC126903098 isoform X2 n=1 Tax=Daktulosphaira vitifoliae TaxID=58002 RepID=UPI0021AA0E09|nr:uncharacterized protein LOC126903098 isoform X2 [Daktulosphaira vitifoliae]
MLITLYLMYQYFIADSNVGIVLILKLLGASQKRCDGRPIETLNKDEVEAVTNKFCNIDQDQNGLINKTEYNELIDLISDHIETDFFLMIKKIATVEMINEWKSHNNEKMSHTI